MLQFILHNRYSLRLFFLTTPTISSHTQIFIPLCLDQFKGCFQINCDSIIFSINMNNTEYQFVCNYYKTNVFNITEFFFNYSIFDITWNQTFDYEHNQLVNTYREQIKLQLQYHFNSINTSLILSDKLNYNWLFKCICCFEQSVSIPTRKKFKLYIQRIRKTLIYNNYYKLTLKKKYFNVLKEWYFAPSNSNGYIKKLTYLSYW